MGCNRTREAGKGVALAPNFALLSLAPTRPLSLPNCLGVWVPGGEDGGGGGRLKLKAERDSAPGRTKRTAASGLDPRPWPPQILGSPKQGLSLHTVP